MDMLRSCYRTRMRFNTADPSDGYPVRWYFVDPPEGAGPLPVPSVFSSRNWRTYHGAETDLGEVAGAYRQWVNGSNFVPEEMPPSHTTPFEWLHGSSSAGPPASDYLCCGPFVVRGVWGFRAGMQAGRLGLRAESVVAGTAARIGLRAATVAGLGFRAGSVVAGSAARLGLREFATITGIQARIGLLGYSSVTTEGRLGLRASGLPAGISNSCCTGVSTTLYLRFKNFVGLPCTGVAALTIPLVYQTSGADAGKWVGSGTPAGSTGGALTAKMYCTGTGATGWTISGTGCQGTGWFVATPDATTSSCSPFKIVWLGQLIAGACCGGPPSTCDLEVKDV